MVLVMIFPLRLLSKIICVKAKAKNSNVMNNYLKIAQLRLVILLLIIISPKIINAQRPELIIPATHSANSVIISPDDKWLISAGEEGIKIWENKTGSLIKNLIPGSKDNKRFDNGRINMAIDEASNLLAMQIADTIYFFDFEKFAISKKIKVNGKRTAMVFSADGKTVYAGGTYDNDADNFIIEKIDVNNNRSELLQKINIVTLATHEITKLSISPAGNELLIYDAVMGSWLLDLSANKIKKQFKDLQNIFPYTYLPNGNLLAFSGKKEKMFFVTELDSKTNLPLRKSKIIFKDQQAVCAMEYTIAYPSQSAKTVLYYQGEFVVFNAIDFSVSNKKQFPEIKTYGWNDSKNIAVSPSCNYYVQGRNMTKNNIASNDVISNYGQFPLDSYVQFVFKNTDGICLKDRIVTFDNGVFNLRLVDPVSKNNDYGFLYRLTADGKTGFIYNEDWGLYRFDPTKAKVEYESIAKINAMRKKFVGMQIFDALNLLALIGNEGIYVLDLKTLRVLYIVDIPYGLHYAQNERLSKFCDISPDNTKMILFAEAREDVREVFGDTSNFIYCVDLSDRNEKWNYQSINIRNLRFVDNGKKLLFTSNDKLFYLDAETGKPIGNPVQLPRSDYETIISPSGNIAATQIPVDVNIDAGSNVGLVNIVNKKSIGIMPGTGDDVSGFVFLRNERYMLTEEYGGLCLWDLDKQRKIGKIYMFEGSADWVMVTDDGRFDATAGALKKMYFTKGKEIIPLESLYEKYYVPGLLKQVWNNTLPNNVPDINDIKSPPVVKISVQVQERNLEVADDITAVKVDKEQVTIKVEANGLKDVVSEIRLYQNGKLVHTTRNLTVEDDNNGEKNMIKTFSVTLSAGENNFKAIAINSQRTESLPALLIANYTPVNVPAKPEGNNIQLHLFVVGVNAYKNPKYNLNYAQADAAAFTEAITIGSQGLFSKVNTTTLKDAEATKEGITAAFEKIKSVANPQDLFIFYYAGHGVVNDKKEFFLVPYDVTQLYGNDGALAQKGFSAAALQQMSKDIKAQKQLFILDACQSAGALEVVAGARGAAEEKAIAQLARSTGTQWLTASGSEQFASEFSQLGHGSFTYCLLQAFKGDANPTDKKLTVKQLDAYLQTKVPEVTQKYKGTPQYPASYSYGNDFPIIIIK
jgi:WD40 repeat protein